MKVSSIREISLLLELNHPNVVQCREVVPQRCKTVVVIGWVMLAKTVKIMIIVPKTMSLEAKRSFHGFADLLSRFHASIPGIYGILFGH